MAVTLEVTLQGRLFEQETALVRHYYSPTAGEVPNTETFVEQLATAWVSYMNPWMSSDFSAERYVVRNALSGSVGIPFTPDGWPIAGEEESTALPSFCCYNIKLNCIEGHKPTHGFARLAGVPISFVAGNVLSGPTISGLDTAFTFYTLTAPITGGGAGAWLPIVYGRTSLLWNQIHTVSVSPYIGHQVSRHVGHGN